MSSTLCAVAQQDGGQCRRVEAAAAAAAPATADLEERLAARERELRAAAAEADASARQARAAWHLADTRSSALREAEAWPAMCVSCICRVALHHGGSLCSPAPEELGGTSIEKWDATVKELFHLQNRAVNAA